MIKIQKNLQLAAVTIKEKAKAVASVMKKVGEIAIGILLFPIATIVNFTLLLKKKVNFYRKNTLTYLKKTLSNFEEKHNIDKDFHLSVQVAFMKKKWPRTLNSLRQLLENSEESPEYKRERYTFLKHTLDLFAITGIDKRFAITGIDTSDDIFLFNTFFYSDADRWILRESVEKILITVDIPQSTWITKHLRYPKGTDIESVIKSYTEELSTDTQQKDRWLSHMRHQKLLYILENNEKYAPLQKMLDQAQENENKKRYPREINWLKICEVGYDSRPIRNGRLSFEEHIKNIQARIDSKK